MSKARNLYWRFRLWLLRAVSPNSIEHMPVGFCVVCPCGYALTGLHNRVAVWQTLGEAAAEAAIRGDGHSVRIAFFGSVASIQPDRFGREHLKPGYPVVMFRRESSLGGDPGRCECARLNPFRHVAVRMTES